MANDLQIQRDKLMQMLRESFPKHLAPLPPRPTPYACHSNPRPVAGAVTHQAQAGWRDTIDHDNAMPTRVPVMADVIHTMSTDCRYDKNTTDPRCAGCPHIQGAV